MQPQRGKFPLDFNSSGAKTSTPAGLGDSDDDRMPTQEAGSKKRRRKWFLTAPPHTYAFVHPQIPDHTTSTSRSHVPVNRNEGRVASRIIGGLIRVLAPTREVRLDATTREAPYNTTVGNFAYLLPCPSPYSLFLRQMLTPFPNRPLP